MCPFPLLLNFHFKSSFIYSCIKRNFLGILNRIIVDQSFHLRRISIPNSSTWGWVAFSLYGDRLCMVLSQCLWEKKILIKILINSHILRASVRSTESLPEESRKYTCFPSGAPRLRPWALFLPIPHRLALGTSGLSLSLQWIIPSCLHSFPFPSYEFSNNHFSNLISLF